jgi:AraC-like DNA-binding protein
MSIPSVNPPAAHAPAEALLVRQASGLVFTFDWHAHDRYELILFTQGRGEALVGDHLGPFQAGDVFLLAPRVPHSFHSPADRVGKTPLVATWLQFRDPATRSIAAVAESSRYLRLIDQANRGLRIPFANPATLRDLAGRITSADVTGYIHLLGLLDELSRRDERTLLSRRAWPGAIPPATVGRINAICRYLHAHHTAVVRLDEIARHVSLSPSQLCADFQRWTGQTVMGYLASLRCRQAGRLLRETDWPVARVAARAGFGSPASFHRMFRRHMGTTPGDWRRGDAR